MNLITKNNIKLFFYNQKNLIKILAIYSIICALLIGNSWDLSSHILLGKSVLNYLLSFGIINNDNYTHYREFYSPSYWTMVYFFIQMFPHKYAFLIFKLFNLLIGWLALIGFYKLNKKLFNKVIATISFLLLYFHPIFFGHLAINPKDIVLAACHIWVFYLILEYFEKQKEFFNSTKIILKISFCLAIGTGVQLYFAASLLPIIFFVIFDVFILKKTLNNNFVISKFLKDFFIVLFFSYIILIFFWVDTHSNIFLRPFELFLDSFSTTRGWSANLLNGNIFYSLEASKLYVFLMTFYKTPEYILFLSAFFIIIFFAKNFFFKNRISFFNYKILIISLIIFFPTFIMLINPFPVYDGIRLFLWYVPYTLIFSSLAIFYLIENLDTYFNKLVLSLNFVLALYYLTYFIFYTPYQYTYLNFFSGSAEEKRIKFENDYWGTSLDELIRKIKKEQQLKNNKILKVYMCAIPGWVVENSIKKNKIDFIQLTHFDDADYILLTNRTIVSEEPEKRISLCSSLVKNEIFFISRLGHKLSVFGEIKKSF